MKKWLDRRWGGRSDAAGGRSWVRRFVVHPFFVPILVFVVFQVAHVGLFGPAYLSDEVGYLTKALTIVGNPAHVSNRWYAGYSLLIAPVLLISHDPFVQWQLIMVLNALMWAVSAWLLRYILQRLRPQASSLALTGATFGAMAYPAWIAMSGYVFSTTSFVFIFTAAIAALLKSNFIRARWLIIGSCLIGFLCWIHPIGYIVAILYAVMMVGVAIAKRQPRFVSLAATAGVVAALGIVYNHVLNFIMDGGAGGGQYTAQLSSAIEGLTHGQFWLQSLEIVLGISAAILVATFGVAFYGSRDIYRRIFRRGGLGQLLGSAVGATELLVVLALLGVVVFSGLATGSVAIMRPDQWIYLRYTDIVMLPVLGLGLLSIWRAQLSAVIAVIVAAIGGLLQYVATPGRTDLGYVNQVNIEGFYPAFLSFNGRPVNFLLWFTIGALAIAVVGAFGRGKWRRWLPLLILPLLVVYAGNYVYHDSILRHYSRPGEVYNLAQGYPTGTCINFSATAPDERYSLYSFYLQNDDVRVTTLDQWLASNCGGLYVTESFDAATYPQLKVVGHETIGNLFIIARR